MTPTIPAPRAEGFTTTTARPLYWREDGAADAPPVLLLHGGPGAHHDYLYPQMLALAESHRVITYDQRGGGQSKIADINADPTPITWQTQVEDLGAVIREFGLDGDGGATLVGYSWGALLAMLYAITEVGAERAQVGRLALISPAPITSAWRREFEAELARRQSGPEIQALREQLAASGLRETDTATFRQRSFELSVAGYFADVQQAESLTPFRVTGRVQQSIWASLGDFDLRDGLRAVTLPVLVLHGRNDPIPLASASAVAEALRGQLVVLESCGHVPYVEQPRALFDALLPFLS
ncbi:MAG: alpha/beta fold hydrolase [Gemmatimonadaceae bacterium]|nr:alpha/beta fold hydrolase [Gemmatimonadaceae bacterium]